MLCRHYLPSGGFGIIKKGRITGNINYHRTALELDSSGSPGICNLDIAYSSTPSKKSIILIPGVTGDSQDNYVVDLVHEGLAKGYNMVVFNHTATKKDKA
jgi:predicted alpha/beta-fold hydrolase